MKFFSKLSLKYKLLTGLLPVVAFVFLFIFYIGTINKHTEESLGSLNDLFTELRVISRLEILNTKLSELTKAFALTQNLKWQTAYDEVSIEFDQLLDDGLSKLKTIDTGTIAEFKIVNNKIKGTELLIIFKAREGKLKEAVELFDSSYVEEQQYASQILTNYVEYKGQLVSDRISSVFVGIADSEKFITIAYLAFMIVVLVLFLFLFSTFILRPLNKLVRVASDIESGNMDARVDLDFEDEIGDLARAFNSMTSALSSQIKKTDSLLKKEEKTRELLEARDSALTSANEMLLELDKKKSEFISIVAHQLRTPLSGIKWTLSNFLEGEMGSLTLEQSEYLKKTYDSNERIINLVEDMLSADRIESGKNPLVISKINLAEITESVLSDLKSKTKLKNITVSFHKNDSVPQVDGDNDKIRAVIQNILENSVRYTPKNGNIEINIVKDTSSSELVLSVKDSGIGIPDDQLKYLFTKFFRAKNAMRMVTDGTGLGLFISKKIIDKHNGRMWCESKEGKGSTFYFSLKV